MIDSEAPVLLQSNFLEQISMLNLMFFHVVLSGLLAIFFVFILPKNYKKNCKIKNLLLLFITMSVFLSEFFLFFYYVVIVFSFYFPYRKKEEGKFETLDFPEFSIHTQGKKNFGGLLGAKERLQKDQLSTQARVDSLMMLQHFSKSHVTEVIRKLLSDEQDDLRLLAFGMLNKREKVINQQIFEQLNMLEELKVDPDNSNRKIILQNLILMRLAELYWSYVYENLVQGDLRSYSLKMAENYLKEVLVIEEYKNPLSVFLFAKIKNAQGNFDEALTYFNLAIELGIVSSRVFPYLAEIYFRQRRYDKVKSSMQQLARSKVVLPSIKGIMGVWIAEEPKSGEKSRI